MPLHTTLSRLLLLPVILALASACQSYTVPGTAADMRNLGLSPDVKRALTDPSIRAAADKRPLVSFPAAIAVAHIQGADYGHGRFAPCTYGGGNYSLITIRDVETEDDFIALNKLPRVTGIVPLKRIIVSPNLQSDLELRAASLQLHADLLLVYTFDTSFYTDTYVQPLTVISLGIFPNKNAHVTTTASALLLDTRTGYIYGVYEATSKDNQLANAWSSEQAMDEARRRAEREAFSNLISQFKTEWPAVLANYDHPQRASRD